MLFQCCPFRKRCIKNSTQVSNSVNQDKANTLFGNRGKRVFILGEQGNKGQILRGTGEQRQYWGTENIKKQIFDFWGTGNKPIYFRGTREQIPPPPTWEGLTIGKVY